MFELKEINPARKQYTFNSGAIKTVIFDEVSYRLTLVFSKGVDIQRDLKSFEKYINTIGGQHHIMTIKLPPQELEAFFHVIESHEPTFSTIKIEIMAMIDLWAKAKVEAESFLARIKKLEQTASSSDSPFLSPSVMDALTSRASISRVGRSAQSQQTIDLKPKSPRSVVPKFHTFTNQSFGFIMPDEGQTRWMSSPGTFFAPRQEINIASEPDYYYHSTGAMNPMKLIGILNQGILSKHAAEERKLLIDANGIKCNGTPLCFRGHSFWWLHD